MLWLIAIITVLFCVSGSYAFEFVTPTGVASGRAIHLSAPGPSNLLNLPVGAPTNKWWRIETGLVRSYDLSDLDQVFVSGGYQYRSATVAFGYSQFGQAALYTEKLAKGSISLRYKSITAGLSVSLLSLGFGGGYEGLSAAGYGFGLGWSNAAWKLAVAADDLNSPTFAKSDPKHLPRYTLCGEFTSTRAYSLFGRTTLQQNERPQFGAGQRVTVGKTSALLWGFTTSPFTLGGGIELGIKAGRLNYSANYHPVLGLTQVISISYGSAMKQTALSNDLR